jgi:hypothetical protein
MAAIAPNFAKLTIVKYIFVEISSNKSFPNRMKGTKYAQNLIYVIN